MHSPIDSDLPVDLSAVPNLPGFSPPSFKENHHKQQRWSTANRQRVEKVEDTRQKFVSLPREKDPWKDGKTLPQATTREVYRKAVLPTVEVPAADVLEHQVLRFFCFFKEHVDESAKENSRVRYCALYYYLEDDTVHVVEPELDNSGIPHGTLIKRHRIPRADAANVYISPGQLRIGENITIYGKTFHLSGCDKFTRDWYSSIQKEQPSNEEFPVDAFVSTCRAEEIHSAKIPMTYDKQFREVMLGGGFVNKNMQQFMERDRMVCRFYAALDDCLTSIFERRLMIILFYLCDDTVEIRESLLPNSSRPSFPVYFRRNRLPKGKVSPVGPCDPVPPKDSYFQIKDFQVGEALKMLDVDFFVYDADAFTREYFSKELNIELHSPVDVSIKLPTPPKAPVPPPTGYGTEEDSLNSVHHIVPKTRIEQYRKSDKLDGKRLWFLARLVEPLQPGQTTRLFSLVFHLNDREIMINEMSRRNVGVSGGRFLQKAKYIDERTDKPFRSEDLSIGSRVKINKHTFDIVDADPFTKGYLLNGEVGDSHQDLHVVLERLRDSMRERLTTTREMFRDLDQDKNEVITVAELRVRLSKVGYDTTDQEALILASHFDQNKDGLVNYVEFCNALQNPEYLRPVKASADRPPLTLEAGPNYATVVRKCDEQIREAEERRKAVRQIQHLLYQQPRLIHKLTKEFTHVVSKNTVTCQQLYEALRSIGHEFPLKTVQRAVAYLMPEADADAIDYIRLLKVLTITYNDMSAER